MSLRLDGAIWLVIRRSLIHSVSVSANSGERKQVGGYYSRRLDKKAKNIIRSENEKHLTLGMLRHAL